MVLRRDDRDDNEVLDVYARVSRMGDDRLRSTEGQVADCTGRVEKRGATVGKVHVDQGRSAWNPRVTRPGWAELMERLESGATGGVIVFDLARFSRRPIEGERLIAAAERGLVVLDSEGEYDLTSASGKKSFRDQMSAAAYESDRQSTRISRGKRRKAVTKGESNHTVRPYGFEQDGVTPREPEASEVRSLTARLLAGETQDNLIRDLNERGVLTSVGRHWTRSGMKQMLTRPRNAGLVDYKGEIVGQVPGEPLVSRDDWEQVVALYASRRRGRPNSPTYTLSGLIHCGLCGWRLSGRTRVHYPYPDGEVRRLYYCQRRGDGTPSGCGRMSADRRAVDAHVRQLVIAILADPTHAEMVEEAARQSATRRAELREKIEELEGTVLEMAARLGREEISLARHDAVVTPLDRRIGEMRAELDALPAEPRYDPSPADAARSQAWWSARWDGAELDERRALVRRALRGRRLLLMPHRVELPKQVFDPARIVLEP